MPLPPPTEERTLEHTRTIEMRGYLRRDGLYEVEGVLRDVKTRDLPLEPPGAFVACGDAIHDISVRLTFDPDLKVLDAIAVFDARPYGSCESAKVDIHALNGAVMAAGWRKEIQARLGHARGCTHIREMLPPMATTAFQTVHGVTRQTDQSVDAKGRPKRIDSCAGYASGGEVVMVRWPGWHGR